jgi:ABC-type transport system involved in cytochrome bd biosynthesis fused ATPase/permease subunit
MTTPSSSDPDQKWQEQRRQWRDQQVQWHAENDDQRPFYKPGMPFRLALSMATIIAFLLMALVVVWFSVVAGIILFICAMIFLVIELTMGGR